MVKHIALLVWLAGINAACAPLLGDYQVVDDIDAQSPLDSDHLDDVAAVDSLPAVDGAPGDTRTADGATIESGLPDVADTLDTTCRCGDPGCCPGVPTIECCAAGACPLVHDTGLGTNYWYCGPLGAPGNSATYTKAMAQAAATTWGAPGTVGGSGNFIWANRPGPTILYGCWGYAGAVAGYAANEGGADACHQITAGGPKTWN
jgi:hypothetical protein